MAEYGKILNIPIEDEMKKSYIDYAMSVIVSRALPDVRDGLKPVHRRILYAMLELGLTPDKPHRKCARIVGEVLGKYHPHGDAPVYEAMARMAQDFSYRYPLVDGHGNFGSIDGDEPAAMRYTEARLSRPSMEILTDIRKETVDFVPNFDDSLKEPAVLPARFPNLLVNGSSGIAVGMATNIPPHNISETIDAVIMMIDNPSVSSIELMRAIKGPDFPTGGLIIGKEGVRQTYLTGKGIIKVRARARIENISKSSKNQIVVTEVPFQVNKSKLLEKIAELVRERKLDGITDLRDESDRHGLRVVIELRKDVNARVVLNRLYKYTPMEQSFGAILLALVNNRPRILTLRDLIFYYLEHQKEVIIRRSRFDLNEAEERAHVVEGLRVALDDIDRVIELIRGSKTVNDARAALVNEFGLSEKQAQAILDMRLQKLTGLEREKLEEEYRELLKSIEYLKAVLGSEEMVLRIIKKELLDIKEKYGDSRRTTITEEETELEEEDLIAEQDNVVTLTHGGYIKRLLLSSYRSQKRGGRGVTGVETKEEDYVEHVVVATTLHQLLFFTNRGRVYRLKAHDIPELGRHAKGIALANLLPVEPGERVTTIIPVRAADFGEGGYLLAATRKGLVKKTEISQYRSARKTGLIALTLGEGDELVSARLTGGGDHIMLVTALGKAIRFNEEQVRPTGRTSLGVIGLRMEGDDRVIGMDAVTDDDDVLLVTKRGYGKRTPARMFTLHNRGGKGMRAIKVTGKTGPVAAVKTLTNDAEVILGSASGVIIRLRAKEIPAQGRDTRGVTLMRLADDDELVSVAGHDPEGG